MHFGWPADGLALAPPGGAQQTPVLAYGGQITPGIYFVRFMYEGDAQFARVCVIH